MKKFVIFTLIIAMAAGAVFAQTANGISVNAWGRGVFAPLVVKGGETAAGKAVDKTWVNVGGAGDGKYHFDEETGLGVPNDPEDWVEVDNPGSLAYSGASTSWGWNKNQIRTDFRINGNAEYVGFQIQLGDSGAEGGTGVGIIDNAYIWAKPFSSDLLKLTVGRFYVDDLRGKVDSDTGFENFVLNPMDACTIFTRFQASHSDGVFVHSNGPTGYMLSSAPIDGLFIGLLVNASLYGKDGWPGEGSVGGEDGDEATKLLDAFRFMQVGFGYNIADIGQLRAQWLGGWFGTVDPKTVGDDMKAGKYVVGPGDPARIEAAFALTAIQNLLVDIGFKFWLPIEIKDGGKKANGVDIALGAKYRMEAFQIIAHIVSNIGSYNRWDKDDKSSNGLAGVNINLIPTYDLDAFTIGASIGVTMSGNATSKDYEGKAPEADYKYSDMQFGFGAFVQKGLGSGSVKAGLAYKAAPIHNEKEADYSGANGSGIFSIPIILEYAFF